MIASTSVIQLLLLARVVFAKETDPSTLLRGARLETRGLVEKTMPTINLANVGLNEMKCEEYSPSDGSVVCVFRAVPPSTGTTGKVFHDCLQSETSGSNYCVSSEFYRATFEDAFPEEVPPQTPPMTGEMPNTPAVLPLSPGCPDLKQNTGMACFQFVPLGESGLTCTWDTLECNCALIDDPSIAEAWDCRLVPLAQVLPEPRPQPLPESPPNPDTSGGVSNTPINPVPEDSLVQPPISIDAQVQNFEDTTTNTGIILPKIFNPEGCPETKPENGVSCDEGQRCKYYTTDANGTPTSALNCDCNGEDVFQCRLAQDPIFTQFSF